MDDISYMIPITKSRVEAEYVLNKLPRHVIFHTGYSVLKTERETHIISGCRVVHATQDRLVLIAVCDNVLLRLVFIVS